MGRLPNLILTTACFSVALAFFLGGPANADDAELDAFTETALLGRFDSDRDGKLNAEERRELRSAFGGVDVPMLPATPFRYTDLALPDYALELDLMSTDRTPADNPLTDAGATLGRVLFYDTQLSVNDTIACASCHDQQHGFSDPRQFSTGFEGAETTRNAMGLANLRFSNLRGSHPGFFWDERAATLEQQALMPIQDETEMGMELSALEAKLAQLPYYPPLFDAAFGSDEITSHRIARALSQFMRSLNSFDAKFDRAMSNTGGESFSAKFDDFTDQENFGKSLFIDGAGGDGEFGCAHCHQPPTFGMPKSFNNGLDLIDTDLGLGAHDAQSNDPFTPSNNGKFKASPLRNVALTAPYMHDGRFETLEEVVEHYSSGVHPHPNLGLPFGDEGGDDQQQRYGFELTDSEKAAIVAFLHTLTDETFIQDRRFSDPFVRETSTESLR